VDKTNNKLKEQLSRKDIYYLRRKTLENNTPLYITSKKYIKKALADNQFNGINQPVRLYN
jgi:hypothetical protein